MPAALEERDKPGVEEGSDDRDAMVRHERMGERSEEGEGKGGVIAGGGEGEGKGEGESLDTGEGEAGLK